MNVTVVGNVNFDIITLPQGGTRMGYGGIIYNLMVLKGILPPGSKLTPVAPLGRKDFRNLHLIFGPGADVAFDGFYHHAPGVNHCHLIYRSPDRREEKLEKNAEPIPFEKIGPHLDADLLIVNFISGCDLSLDTMKRVRERFPGPIVMDVQSMSLSLENGLRRVRPIPGFFRWVALADLVHLSEDDLRAQVGDGISDFASASLGLARTILSNGGVAVVMVSLGAAGSYVHFTRRGEVRQLSIPAYPARTVDPTGCGDAYTTAFACHYALNSDPEAAGHYASRLAARVAELPEIDSIPGIGPEFRLASTGEN